MSWTAVLVTLGAPVLVAAGGLVSWYFRSRLEEIRAAERNLNDERRRVYADILQPFILAYSSGNDPDAMAKLHETVAGEYRRTIFELSLIGSDEVVRAYGDLMQLIYRSKDQAAAEEMMKLWGGLLLEIRRSLGNKGTQLSRSDMLRGLITDIDRYSIG